MADHRRLTYSSMTLQTKDREIPVLEALSKDHDLRYCTKNGGAHVIVMLLDETRFDFWPSSGRWAYNNGEVQQGGFIEMLRRRLGVSEPASVGVTTAVPERVYSFAGDTEVEEDPFDFAQGVATVDARSGNGLGPEEGGYEVLVGYRHRGGDLMASRVVGRFDRSSLAATFLNDLLHRL